jgi:hypothetical protein
LGTQFPKSCPQTSGEFVAEAKSETCLKGVKITSEADLEKTRQWCKENRLKNGRIKHILKHAKKTIHNPEISDFTWLYPEGVTEPPENFKRVYIKPCSKTSFESYSTETTKSFEYGNAEVEKIMSQIKLGNNLSEHEKDELREGIKGNIKALSTDKGDLGYTTLIEHEIDLISDTPVKMKPYKLSFEEQKVAAEFIQPLLKEGQILPSKSPWSTPAFLVPKPKPGEYRLVCDCRQLNLHTRAWSMPLPFMSDLQQQLGQARFFAMMDITSGFYNVPMKREHREYSAFCFRNLGLFEWLVMPMGLENLPATFTRLQEIVFPPSEWSDILKVFIDDMCVFLKTLPELKVYLDRVLKRLIWAGLKLCPSKCEFGSNSVQFQDHVISDGKMTMSERKTEAIRKLLPPSNVKELQQVLGLFQ